MVLEETALHSDVAGEIDELHRFFVDWFTGKSPADADEEEFKTRFLDRLDAGFVLIPPAGRILERDRLETGIRAGRGSNPDFRIAIRNVRIHYADRSLVLATYEEWQRNALASTPPDNGRIATVLFNRVEGVLRWRHVHETWLPEPVMMAGPYDF